jgi:carboxymethylenebutenolidase
MIEQQISLRTRDGVMETFICHPERDSAHPIVIVYMDAFGIREELRDMVRRIATTGYYVMLPNLYYRSGVMEIARMPSMDDKEGVARILGYMAQIPISAVMRDTETLFEHAASQSAASPGSAATVGYCMSGQYAIGAAGHFSDRITAAVSIYGTRLLTDESDSPHLAALRAKGELYVAFAEIDHFVPLEEYERFRRHVADAGIRAEVELYAGFEHGFAFPARESYNKTAAERHWERIHSLLRRKLPTRLSS